MRAIAALHRPAVRALCTAAVLSLPCATRAQWSGSITVDSDYRFRGISLSDSKPALRLNGNLDTASGWYAGAAATQAKVGGTDPYAQVLGYGGFVRPIAQGRSLEFGASYSHFTTRAATTSPKPMPGCFRTGGRCA